MEVKIRLFLCTASTLTGAFNVPEEKIILVAKPFFANLAWYLEWFSERMSVTEKRSAPKNSGIIPL